MANLAATVSIPYFSPVILAFSPVIPRESGNPEGGGRRWDALARKAALARVTLTLALSHKGRGDPLVGICT